MKPLIETDDYFALTDPLLEYLVEVCNHFWPGYEPRAYSVDAEGNKKWGAMEASWVPEEFADRIFANVINTRWRN